jgi:hypothetical protein
MACHAPIVDHPDRHRAVVPTLAQLFFDTDTCPRGASHGNRARADGNPRAQVRARRARAHPVDTGRPRTRTPCAPGQEDPRRGDLGRDADALAGRVDPGGRAEPPRCRCKSNGGPRRARATHGVASRAGNQRSCGAWPWTGGARGPRRARDAARRREMPSGPARACVRRGAGSRRTPIDEEPRRASWGYGFDLELFRT